MSFGFPFPSDRLALARSDFCEDPDASARTSWDARTCHLRARQCATHVQAAGDQHWARRAVEPIGDLLAPARVERWRPTTGHAQGSARGGCQLLALSGAAGEALGAGVVGPARIREAYGRVAGDRVPSSADTEALVPTRAWGSRAWFAREYAKTTDPSRRQSE
jgi:hypothetical protein